MNIRRTIFASAALAALAGAGMVAASPSAKPGEEPRRTRHKPSGNTPVPGGGARERARRLAKMQATNPDGVTEPCDVCGNEVDVRADACHHCG